jgi:hypothetical protein
MKTVLKDQIPGCFNSLGMIQRTKCGSVQDKDAINLLSCSY